MPISVEQWRVATGLANARYALCPARSAASPRKYLSRGTLFLRACVAVLQALLILALDTDWWGPCVGSVRGHSIREPVVIVVVHLHVSGSEGQSSVRFYVPALRILLIIAGDVEENPGPPKVEVSRLEVRHLKVLRDELADVSRKWYDIGLELDLHPDTLETIQQQETSLPVCLRQMLMQWLKRKEPPPTWEALATALESCSVGEGHLAEQLREKYCHKQRKSEKRGDEVESEEMSEQVAVAVERKRKKEDDGEVIEVKRKCPTSISDQPFAHSSQLDLLSIQVEMSGAHACPSVPSPHPTFPAPPPALPPMEEYASYLKSVYMSKKLPTYSKWPPTSSKRFIHLAVVKKQRVSKKEANEFTRATIHGNIDDILHKKEPVDFSKVGKKDDGSPAKFILIEGAPGIGKTTFAWKLCRKWAKRKILTAYRLVVLLKLRDKRVREAKSALDLFYHFDPDLSSVVAKQVLRCNGRSLFLLFEGYDELPGKLQTEQSIFLDILYKNFLPEATVLVTSRPSATEFLHWTFRKEISQHIEILGFTKDDIQSYIHSVMDDPQVQEDFTQYLKCYPYIRGMMYVPLNAVIVAEVYKESRESPDKFIPTTMTELYTALTKNLLLRYLFSHGEYGKRRWRLKSFLDLPQKLFEQFCTICTIAFNGTIRDEFVFDDLPEDFNTLDLMQSSPELYVNEGTLVSYNFFHLTLQEYLAAVHISHQRPEEQIEYFRGSFRKVLHPQTSAYRERGRGRGRGMAVTPPPHETGYHVSPVRPGHLRTETGTEYSHHTPRPTARPPTPQGQQSDLTHEELSHSSPPHTSPHGPTIPPMRTSASLHAPMLPFVPFVPPTPPMLPFVPYVHPTPLHATVPYPQHTMALPQGPPILPAPSQFDEDILQMLSPPSLHTPASSSVAPSQIDEDETAQMLKNSLRFAAGVTKFENLPLDSPHGPTMPPMRTRTPLHAPMLPSVPYTPLYATVPSQSSPLHTMALPQVPLNQPLVQIPSTPSLHTTVPSSYKTAQRLKNTLRFAAGVAKFENLPLDSLRSLLLEDEDISLDALHWLFEAQCIDTYSNAISGTTNLQYSHFDSMTPFDCFVLGHAVSHINCTWTVDLNICRIGNEGLEMLVAGMHYNKDTSPHSRLPVSLYLTNCDITPEGLHYLTEMPEHVATSVTGLNLHGNPIGGGAAHFFSKLPALRSLEYLSLNNTKVTSEDTKALGEFLSQPGSQQLEQLKYLSLDNNLLTPEGTGWILGALRHNTTLETLALDDSHVTMENVSSLTRALRGQCGLKILWLNNCKIGPDTACEIASVLCENSTLEELHMSKTPIGPRGAAAFVDMLRKNRTLKYLYLCDDSIGEEGARKLAESLQYNTTLNKLLIPEKYVSSLPPELYSTIQDRLKFL